ncbi:MAG: M48 family metalloprotease [Bdellovibrionales bacterium]|nr:M48 family metalloprotease [Bdellovibrionales bacterium]
MAYLWVHYDYSKAIDGLKPTPENGLRQPFSALHSLVQTLRTLAFFLCMWALVYLFNVFGFLIFFYATPIFVRVLFDTLPMTESRLTDEIRAVFKQAGVDLGHIRIIQTKKRNTTNAMVCGTKWGFGPLKRTLLVTDNLFSRLSEEEFVAVMRHEASHFRLHHIRKRVFAVLYSYLLSVALASIPVILLVSVMIKFQLQQLQLQAAASIFAALGALYCMNRMIYNAIHRHEHEADVEAVKMGSSSEAMIGALQKITDDHGTNYKKRPFLTRFMLSQAHPSLEERINVIHTGEIPQEQFLKGHVLQVASAYALMLVATFYFVSTKPETPEPKREIASEHPAAIVEPVQSDSSDPNR